MLEMLIALFIMFAKLGLVTFGGGYAMLPMMQQEIANLISSLGADPAISDNFTNLIAISQMTPGPIAINAATYVGFMCAGFFGSLVSTIAVCLPAFAIMLTIAHYFDKFKQSAPLNHLLQGIRPATVGLILASITIFANGSILNTLKIGEFFSSGFTMTADNDIVQNLFSLISPGGLLIFALAIVATKIFKAPPIPVTIGAGILGAFICGII